MKEQNHFLIAAPRLPKEPAAVKPAGPVQDDDSYSDCLIEHGAFSGEARHVNFLRAALRGVRFEASLRAAEFEDVLFEGCDLSNVDLSDAILLRTAFVDCRMTGVNFSGAVLRDTAFENSMTKYASFRFARFDRAAFTGCNCTSADFEEVSFTKTRFAQTSLRQVQMSGTALANIDLTSCDIDGLGARPEDLRGAVLTPEQAITAAKIIGVVIRF
ncbi:MAG: pentapeptide repeat-containing protein [Clostridia bacterium]|nr:pentapeptide repeat-containing protein [Clostridia bacterium]MDR3645603.1 pentapeptide repeat-containing protein [Clostridia bacterium]